MRRGRGRPGAVGQREGVQALKRTNEAAHKLGIGCLTVVGFSTENWSRPEDEVSDLMGLVRTYVASDLKRLEKAGVRLRVLGRRDGLPADIADITLAIAKLPPLAHVPELVIKPIGQSFI